MVSCLGWLVQSCCEEGGALQTDGCVWGALSVFRPHWVCRRSWVCALRIYTAQAPGCSIWSGPCVACSSSFRVLHKSADSVGPVFCAFPGGISSGGQELDELTLPRCGVPSPLQSQPQFLRTSQVPAACVYSREVASSRDPPGGCRPSRISGSLWLETGDLFAVW